MLGVSLDAPARRTLRQSIITMSASTSRLPVQAVRMMSVKFMAGPVSRGMASSSFRPHVKHWQHGAISTSAPSARYLHGKFASSGIRNTVHFHTTPHGHRQSHRQDPSTTPPQYTASTPHCTCHRMPSVHVLSPLMARHLSMAARRQAPPSDSLSSQPRTSHSQSSQSDSEMQAQEESSDKDASLTGRLKSLIRNYGWAAIVVYILFSFVDFGITFFLINLIGADYVQRGVDYVLDTLIYGLHVHDAPQGSEEEVKNRQEGSGIMYFLKNWREKNKATQAEHAHDAEKRSGAQSLWATAALAYGIHKTLLLPVRLGATAAATPAIVRQLQKWGINIARNPIPEQARVAGAAKLREQKVKLDKARKRHSNWL